MKLKLCKHENIPYSHRVNLRGKTGDYGYWVIECICRKGIEKTKLTGGIKYTESVHAQNEEDAIKEWNNRPNEHMIWIKGMKTAREIILNLFKTRSGTSWLECEQDAAAEIDRCIELKKR